MFVLEFLKNIIFSYLILTFLLTVYKIIKMMVVKQKVGVPEYGRSRVADLKKRGLYKSFWLYSIEECQVEPKKKGVALHYLPSDNKKYKQTLIVCPGGGYAHLASDIEGFSVAAKFNEMGFDAFVLEYRTGPHCSNYAPMEDLAKSLHFIIENENIFEVNSKDYLLCGFSAGGNLCGMFGTKQYGYSRYDLTPPSGLILGYPWTNINHWIEHPYWNIWIGLIAIYLSERGNINMFGFFNHFKRKYRDSICVQRWVDEEYPDTYMFACSGDMLVPCGAHTDILEKAFENKNIRSEYEKFFALPHGIGLAVGTKASVWPENAINFLLEKK